MRTGVWSWVSYWAQTKAADEAIVCGDRTKTWGELGDDMERGARVLASLGVERGDRVAVLMGNRPEFYEAYFAIARLGAVFVPVNVRLSPPEIAYVLEDSGAKVVITESTFGETLGKLADDRRQIVDVDGLLGVASEVAKQAVDLSTEIDPPEFEDLLGILYTSGTTGHPKGAMLTHAAVHFAAQNLLHMYNYTQADRHLVVLPLCFTGGIITLSQPVFLSGGTIVLEKAFEPGRTLDVIEQQRVSVFFAAPALLQLLRLHEKFGPEPFATVRLIIAGAAPVPEPMLVAYQALGVNVGQGYGLTEGGGIETFLPTADATRKIGSVGRSCMFTEVRVADPDGTSVPVGERGEILLRGPNMMQGYWRNEEATTAAFSPGGWLRTGDVGVLDDEGFLTVVDRLKDMVITGGMNVYPAEVESVLYEHKAVAEAAVVGIDHPVYGETVAAVVVLRSGAELDLEGLRSFCDGRLAGYKIPRILAVVNELPRNTSGKVLKYELREDLLSNRSNDT